MTDRTIVEQGLNEVLNEMKNEHAEKVVLLHNRYQFAIAVCLAFGISCAVIMNRDHTACEIVQQAAQKSIKEHKCYSPVLPLPEHVSKK